MEIFKLENVELMWPFLYERNKLSGKYQVDLVNLNKEQVEAIEKTGVPVKQKEDKGFFVTCKSTNYEITPYDKNGDVISKETKVGNGSRADIVLKPYSWKSPTGQSGMSLGISKLVVKDLNVYNPEPVSMDEDTL
jgi:hypothetical protein